MAERCFGQHLLESDGLNPHFFYLLSKENKRSLKSCEMFIPPTLMFDQGYVKAMFSTEVHQSENGEAESPSKSASPADESMNAANSSSSPKQQQQRRRNSKKANFVSGMNSLKPGEIKRKSGKDVDLEDVYESFTAGCRDSDVAAVMLYAAPRSTDMNHVKFLDKGDLKRLFFVDIDKPKCLLQQFIRPKGNNNFMVLATWTPLMIMAEGRRCPNALDARHLPVAVRGATFEDPSISTVEVVVNRTVVRSINDVCCNMAAHFEKTERLSLTRFAGYFKVDEQNRLYLLYPTSIRMHEGDAIDRRVAPISLSHAMSVTKQKGVVEDEYLKEVDGIMDDYDSKVNSGKMRINIPSMMDTYSLIRHSVHGTTIPQHTSTGNSVSHISNRSYKTNATSGMTSVAISGPASLFSTQGGNNATASSMSATNKNTSQKMSPSLNTMNTSTGSSKNGVSRLTPVSHGGVPQLHDPSDVFTTNSVSQYRTVPPLSSASPIAPTNRVFPGGVRQLNPTSEARLVSEQFSSLDESKKDLRAISRGGTQEGRSQNSNGRVGGGAEIARSASPILRTAATPDAHYQDGSGFNVPPTGQASRYNAKHPNRAYKSGREKYQAAAAGSSTQPPVDVSSSNVDTFTKKGNSFADDIPHHMPDSAEDAMTFVSRVRDTLQAAQNSRTQLPISHRMASNGVVLPPMFLAQEPPSDLSNQGLIRRGFPDQGPSLRLSKPAPRSRTVAVTSPKRVAGSQRPADLVPNSTTLQRKKSDLEVQHEALIAVDIIPESNGCTWELGSEAKHLQHARRDFRAEQVVAQASVAHILERVAQQDAHISSWFTESQRVEIERRTMNLLDNVTLYIQELSYAIYDMFLSRRCPVAFVEVPRKFQAFLSVQTIHSILFKLHGTVFISEDYLCENLPKAEAGTNDILKYRNRLVRGLHTGVLETDWPFRSMDNLGEYLVYLREGRDYVLPTIEDEMDEAVRRDSIWTPVSSHLEKEIKTGKTMVLLPQAATDTFVSGVTASDIIRQRREVIGKATGRARAAQINSLSVNSRNVDDDDDLNDPAARRSQEQRLAAERRRLALLDGFDSGADESDLDESDDEEVRNLDNALVSTTISDAVQFHPFDRTIKSYNASHALVIPLLNDMGLEVLKSECGMDITRDAAPFLHPKNGIVSYFVREYVIRGIKREERNQKDEDRAREAFFQANRHNNNTAASSSLPHDADNDSGTRGNGGNSEIADLEHEFKRLRKKRVDERRRERRRQRHMIHRHIENLSVAEAKKTCQQQRAVTEAKRLRALQLQNREAQTVAQDTNPAVNDRKEEDNTGDQEAFRYLIASSQASLSAVNSPIHHQSNQAMDPLPAPTPVSLTTTSTAPQPSIQAGPQTNPLDIVCSRCHKCRVLCVCHKVFRSLSKRL